MASLYSIFDSIHSLPGLKPKVKEGLALQGINSVSDLLLYKPRMYEDRSRLNRACQVRGTGSINTFIEVVNLSYFGPPEKKILKIVARECMIQDYENNFVENTINLLCFNRNFMARYVKEGMRYYLVGNATRRYTTVVDVSSFELHPVTKAEEFGLGEILSIYPLNSILTQKSVRGAVKLALDRFVHTIENDMPDEIHSRNGLLSMAEAIYEIHRPSCMDNIEKARRTLAFNEIFFLLLKYGYIGGRKDDSEVTEGVVFDDEEVFIQNLPFELTPSQERAIRDIREDLDSNFKMKRLLQGDVGSGKTVVAFISALHEITKGNQVAFMVPTELLSIQHYANAQKLFKGTGVNICLFKGGMRASEREELIDKIRSNKINLIIGTHSLINDKVEFSKSLSYVIIDEEHRFGVEQREALQNKSKEINVLSMSATPIPRSLAEAVCGRLNVSTITEQPAHRTPIITHLVSSRKRKEMYEMVGVEFSRGHQAYFVTPRIDSTQDDLKDVYALEKELREVYQGIPYGLIHSRIPDKDKELILQDFQNGRLKYIIATSVVEVGLDNPNATCMVIENAERFGLATLHQLRGRVGRGHLQSWCFLVYKNAEEITDTAALRLKAMKETNNGFELAEMDADVRGVGDILGTKQSGASTLRFASLDKDMDLLSIIRKEIHSLDKRR